MKSALKISGADLVLTFYEGHVLNYNLHENP